MIKILRNKSQTFTIAKSLCGVECAKVYVESGKRVYKGQSLLTINIGESSTDINSPRDGIFYGYDSLRESSILFTVIDLAKK